MRADILRVRVAEYLADKQTGTFTPPDTYSAWRSRQLLADHIADTAIACTECGILRPKDVEACPDCEGRQ